jgi:hypothetical protein
MLVCQSSFKLVFLFCQFSARNFLTSVASASADASISHDGVDFVKTQIDGALTRASRWIFSLPTRTADKSLPAKVRLKSFSIHPQDTKRCLVASVELEFCVSPDVCADATYSSKGKLVIPSSSIAILVTKMKFSERN